MSFYKKGARLGPILAFLVATPATSVSALLVAYSVLGLKFAIYIFFAVIIMGVFVGMIGNLLTYEPKKFAKEADAKGWPGTAIMKAAIKYAEEEGHKHPRKWMEE